MPTNNCVHNVCSCWNCMQTFVGIKIYVYTIKSPLFSEFWTITQHNYIVCNPECLLSITTNTKPIWTKQQQNFNKSIDNLFAIMLIKNERSVTLEKVYLMKCIKWTRVQHDLLHLNFVCFSFTCYLYVEYIK